MTGIEDRASALADAWPTSAKRLFSRQARVPAGSVCAWNSLGRVNGGVDGKVSVYLAQERRNATPPKVEREGLPRNRHGQGVSQTKIHCGGVVGASTRIE